MTAELAAVPLDQPPPRPTRRPYRFLLFGLPFALAVALLSTHVGWIAAWPADWAIPLSRWVTDALKWAANDLGVGPVTLKDTTRGLAWLLDWPLQWSEDLLFDGFRSAGIGPLPWVVVLGGATLLGHGLGGRRLALLCGLATLYLAVFNLWADAMRTLSLVIITVPLAAATGLLLGVLSTRSRRAETFLAACFDVMQATPHLAYLGPVAVFFGFGPVPAMIASALFAIPPMARCVILGIRTVPREVIEAGQMAGCTARQMLWRVELPASQQTLLLGLNQVVMQTLAMAVIASLIGATGLGHKLLFSLQQLQIGKAIENGVAIVLIAIVLDRLTQAWARRVGEVRHAEGGWARRHWRPIAFLALLAVTLLLAGWIPELRRLPKALTTTTAPLWDEGIRWLSKNLFDALAILRDDLTVHVLIPIRNAFTWLPWPLVAGLVALAGWRLGGWRLAALTGGMVLAIALVGLWQPAMLTLYLTSLAVLICMCIGVPIGIWASRRPRAARAVLTVCDTLQTFPSFIYLIPVIMLFRVGDLASLVAILAYAMVPAVRYTHLGMSRVPGTVLEAARAAGATRGQILRKVELPVALPEIMLGLNQTILMALAMTAITALIGSRDLGQEILKALPEVDTGRGLLAGLAIAFIGIIADRLIGAWARRRKAELGLA
jgi:glycine betaine/proline transport system permease protein